MKIVSDLWFVKHLDWYTLDPEIGYVPTELAPPEAVEAMERVNAMSEEDLA